MMSFNCKFLAKSFWEWESKAGLLYATFEPRIDKLVHGEKTGPGIKGVYLPFVLFSDHTLDFVESRLNHWIKSVVFITVPVGAEEVSDSVALEHDEFAQTTKY